MCSKDDEFGSGFANNFADVGELPIVSTAPDNARFAYAVESIWSNANWRVIRIGDRINLAPDVFGNDAKVARRNVHAKLLRQSLSRFVGLNFDGVVVEYLDSLHYFSQIVTNAELLVVHQHID